MTDAAIAQLNLRLQEASGEARRAFLWFGSFGAYFVTTVAATTHENLLRGTAVKLPLLNVDLPIVGFYVIAPLLFLLLHFYLLFQLYLLSVRARELMAAAGADEARATGPSFPVAQYLLGGLGRFRPLFGLGIWLAVILLPALALIFVQVRFLPYHSTTITGLHRGLVVVDTAVVVLLWYLTARGLTLQPRQLMLDLPRKQDWGRRLLGGLGYGGLLGFAILITWFSAVVAIIPPDLATPPVDPEGAVIVGRDPCAPQTRREAVAATPTPAWTPPDRPELCTTFARPQDFPRMYEPRPAFDGAPRRRMLCLTYLLFEAPTTPLDMRRNLVVRGASFAAATADAGRVGTGFDLRGRDLRFADFTGSDLTGADLRGANLYGAELTHTVLRFADLGDVPETEFDVCRGFYATDGHGNRFCRTVARAANLARAQLEGARLLKIDLRGARLDWADLRAADLGEADAAGASLSNADLSAARLRGIQLDSAALREVRAIGANLTCARAERADLTAADLTLATAGRIRLVDADMEEARLVGTYLARADLSGARLAGAYLEGVDLRAARLTGVTWDEPPLAPARVRLSDLRGVRLESGTLGGAVIDDDVVRWDGGLPPTVVALPEFDEELLKLLLPLRDRPERRSGLIGRLESERNDSCQVRPYQARLAAALLDGACERDERFTPAEWWVLQTAHRTAATPAEDADASPSCRTGPPPTPGECVPLPWAPVDTPEG